MGYETLAAITENMERALKAEGLNVVRKTLDLRGSLPAGMMPLAQVCFTGESFEDTFGERPSRTEAAFSLKIIIPERPDSQEAREEQMWAHRARGALSEEALNAGALAASKPVLKVILHGFEVESGGGFSRITMEVKARYRES